MSDGLCVHVNRPAQLYVRAVRYCRSCRTRRRHVGTDTLWYGIWWLCRCGAETPPEQGTRRPRSERRAKVNAKKVRVRWGQAVRAFGPEHREWLVEGTDHE